MTDENARIDAEANEEFQIDSLEFEVQAREYADAFRRRIAAFRKAHAAMVPEVAGLAAARCEYEALKANGMSPEQIATMAVHALAVAIIDGTDGKNNPKKEK